MRFTPRIRPGVPILRRPCGGACVPGANVSSYIFVMQGRVVVEEFHENLESYFVMASNGHAG